MTTTEALHEAVEFLCHLHHDVVSGKIGFIGTPDETPLEEIIADHIKVLKATIETCQ